MTTTRDCNAERTIYRDAEIEVSVNHIRPEAPVWWRYDYHDEGWQQAGLQTADLGADPLSDVRAQMDLDEE